MSKNVTVRLRASNHQPSSNSGNAYRDLKYWGKFVRRSIYFDSSPTCQLSKLVEYGIHVPSGYCEVSYLDPQLKQIQRVWAFMPEKIKEVLIMHFVIEADSAIKMHSLQISRQLYNYYLDKGMAIYDRYKDTNFGVFDG